MTEEATPDKPAYTYKVYLLSYYVLLLISIPAAASYFAYDCVGPLTPLFKSELSLTTQQTLRLYSIYSIPVIFLVVLGGVLADKLGVRKASVLFTALFALGTVLTAVPFYPVMLLGRLIFGFGAECFYVVLNKILAKWFKDKGLALAFGVNLFLLRAGTYAAFYGIPWLAEGRTLTRTLWYIAGINVAGLLAAIVYIYYDHLGERRRIVSFAREEEEKFRLADALRLPSAFWVISLLCMVYYGAIFPFQGCATDFITERYGMDSAEASRLTSNLILMTMFTTWIFGAVVDRVGKRATLMIVGTLALVPCHVSMAYTDVPPLIPILVLGLSFSLVPAALWPALPLMVKESQLGTAYGVIAMIQNIGLYVFPECVGWIRDRSGSYNGAMILFAGLSALGVIFAIWLKVIEARGGGYLDKAYRKGA